MTIQFNFSASDKPGHILGSAVKYVDDIDVSLHSEMEFMGLDLTGDHKAALTADLDAQEITARKSAANRNE